MDGLIITRSIAPFGVGGTRSLERASERDSSGVLRRAIATSDVWFMPRLGLCPRL